jgi:hypothetical protein
MAMTLTLSPDHVSEVEEIIETDDLVRSRVAQLIDELTTYGRTLPSPHATKHRYSDLIDCIADAVHDGMPSAREIGDDPFI